MIAARVTQRMVVTSDGEEPLIVNLSPPLQPMSADEFLQFCAANGDLRIEQTAEGDILIMPPAYSETGAKNFNLAALFGVWARADGTGIGFDSSAGFTLPNGAVRSPDVSWIRLPRWEALPQAERMSFAPICPDFVVELRSTSDRLTTLQKKMEEYVANGAQLGWLIDPIERKVHVYRPGEPVECLENPERISGDPLLSGFVLELKEVWD